jgi:16S rRNA (cytosine1402-N4)-methyltransferase
VLAAEVLEHLGARNDGVIVDGTLGGAGHAAALLGHLTNTTLIGIDRDPSALEAAREKLAPFGDRARLVHGEYADMGRILAELGVGPVTGILLDLGVSSPQLDQAERGFSFMKAGPLDMRMDPTRGRTALELITELEQDDLAELIKELGEERYGKKIARLIKEAVAADRVHTTTELAAVIAMGIPIIEQRKSKIHPATRTFQALRIAVNAELNQLERFLFEFPDLLAPGGRCQEPVPRPRVDDVAAAEVRRRGGRAARGGVRADHPQVGGRRGRRDRAQPTVPLRPPARVRAHRGAERPRDDHGPLARQSLALGTGLFAASPERADQREHDAERHQRHRRPREHVPVARLRNLVRQVDQRAGGHRHGTRDREPARLEVSADSHHEAQCGSRVRDTAAVSE